MPLCMIRFSMTVGFSLVWLLPASSLIGISDNDVRPARRAAAQSKSSPDSGLGRGSAARDALPAQVGAGRCDALVQEMKKAATPLARVERGLAAARCAIVLSCAPPLSRELYDFAPDPGELASSAATGKACLKGVADALRQLPRGFDAERRRILQDRVDMLNAFAELFSALGAADGSRHATTRLTDACIGLAVFVDDSNPGVAESAKLWQGVAYRRAGRAGRTLNLLRPAIGSLHSSRVDFFTRMERCRALVDEGRFVAAESLAMRLEKRVNTWLLKEHDSARKRAAESLRRLRGVIYKRWASDLRSHGKEDRAKAAEDAMRRILGDASSPPTFDEVLPLDQTIAGLPEWKMTEPAPTTQAAGASK